MISPRCLTHHKFNSVTLTDMSKPWPKNRSPKNAGSIMPRPCVSDMRKQDIPRPIATSPTMVRGPKRSMNFPANGSASAEEIVARRYMSVMFDRVSRW